MPQGLLAHARKHAVAAGAEIRAAALMRIARVQTASDAAAARATFEEALPAIGGLEPREREWMLDLAKLIAAAVAPERIDEFPAEHRGSRDWITDRVCRTMLDHGHTDDALDFLMRQHAEFPFGVLHAVMPKADVDKRQALLRHATAAWREMRGKGNPFAGDQFAHIFAHYRDELPREEALALLHEVVARIEEGEDQEVSARFDAVFVSSRRAMELFNLLHVLRDLDAPLAERLIATHPQLATAAARYPDGLQTMQEEAEARRPEAGTCGGGFIMGGSPRDFPYLESLMRARREGDFSSPLAHANERYKEDASSTSPNRVPKEFWPSTHAYRQVMHTAGRQLGRDAARLLDAIPDPDLRAFAEIELAAALAGLPELGSVQREFRPRVRAAVVTPEVEEVKDTGTGGPRIRCPKCGWTPRAEDRWQCNCGHVWNTFDTGGVCPGCMYQWTITQCLSCGEISRHSDWYTQS